MKGRKPVDVVSVAQLLSALGTLLLAGLTVANVRLTRRTIGEMQAARISQFRPQVIVDADLDDQFMLDVVVKNIGGGAAKDITFEFSHPLVRAGNAAEKPPLSELDHFKKGIDFLAPGAQIRTAWGTYPSLDPLLKEKRLEEGITITSKYKSLDSSDRTNYKTDWTINLLRFSGAPRWVRRGEHEIAKAIESIAKDVHQMVSHYGLKVITRTEKLEEDERLQRHIEAESSKGEVE